MVFILVSTLINSLLLVVYHKNLHFLILDCYFHHYYQIFMMVIPVFNLINVNLYNVIIYYMYDMFASRA